MRHHPRCRTEKFTNTECDCGVADEQASSANRDLLNSIDTLTQLKHGWDSYNGIAVKREAAEKAKELLKHLPDLGWQAVPGSDGSLQLESHRDGFDIEVDIEAV